MSESVIDVQRAVLRAVQAVEPALLSGADAERLMHEFRTIERAASAAVMMLMERAAACGAATRDGAKSDADWAARQSGTSVGKARRRLDAAKNLKRAPKTAAALKDGQLSEDQAETIAAAAAAVPEDEERLLRLAGHQPLNKLQDEAARTRARGEGAKERRDRIHRERSWRTWTDREGARCGQYRLTPEAAATIEAAAKPFVDAAFDQARREGRREPSEAYAADGLVAMARAASGNGADGAPTKSSVQPILLVNIESLLRGSLEGDEVCEIPGVGPVSLAAALELLGPEGLKIVIKDGVDIRTVVHLGRHPTAAQRTAIFVRDRGRCIRPTCPRPMAEVDHTADWSETRQTRLDDLGGVCDHDHDLKTHHGHTYRHGPNGWEWHRPDGAIEVERPPPDDG